MAIDVNTVVSYLNNIRSGLDQFESYLMAASEDDQPAEGSPEFERRINRLASVKLRSFLDVLDQMEAAGEEPPDGVTAVQMFDQMEAEHDHDVYEEAAEVAEEAAEELQEELQEGDMVPRDTVPMNGIFPTGPDGDYIFSTDMGEARAISRQVNLEEDAKRRADRNSARKDRYEDHAEEMEGLV